ncbi:MAG: class I SAM-dependent methyltransferase [Ruminococcaceae bacterium]|nr:class I SAM-dependent methyltransferase [Oscillospiraceae bacterium]
MFDGYSVLAPVYDRLNGTVDYRTWAQYIENCFGKFTDKKIRSVLDLGCGTGSMTLELAARGYDMTGIDLSEDMLSVADSRVREAGLDDVLFICGNMASFELYGTVDAVVCCLDGINHLHKKEDLLSCFSLVANYLEDDGLFIFDLNTPHKFSTVYSNNDYILEDDGIMCCWRNRLSKKGDVVDFYLTVYEEQDDGTWLRSDGIERERAYGLRAIENALNACGLKLVDVSSGYDFEPITKNTERWYITAKKSR